LLIYACLIAKIALKGVTGSLLATKMHYNRHENQRILSAALLVLKSQGAETNRSLIPLPTYIYGTLVRCIFDNLQSSAQKILRGEIFIW